MPEQEERRTIPVNNFPYQCVHERTLSRIESDLENTEQKLEGFKVDFQQLLNKLEIMTSQMPLIHHKQDEYTKGFDSLMNKLIEIDTKVDNRLKVAEREWESNLKSTELRLDTKIDSGLKRFHERVDEIHSEHKKLHTHFYRALYIGIGVWVCVTFAFNQVQPFKKIETLYERVELQAKEIEELKKEVRK